MRARDSRVFWEADSERRFLNFLLEKIFLVEEEDLNLLLLFSRSREDDSVTKTKFDNLYGKEKFLFLNELISTFLFASFRSERIGFGRAQAR